MIIFLHDCRELLSDSVIKYFRYLIHPVGCFGDTILHRRVDLLKKWNHLHPDLVPHRHIRLQVRAIRNIILTDILQELLNLMTRHTKQRSDDLQV